MNKSYYLLGVASLLLYVGVASAQHPILNMVADKVIQKYQNSSCQQLWQEKAQNQGHPKPAQEQELIQILHTNPQLQAEFINKIAAPVVNKMFECGMVP